MSSASKHVGWLAALGTVLPQPASASTVPRAASQPTCLLAELIGRHS